MMLPVRTTVSYQAADEDYEAPREQRAAPELYKNSTSPALGIFAAYFLLVARKCAHVIYCHHFRLGVM